MAIGERTEELKGIVLEGRKVTLRLFEEGDVNERYLRWMNDPAVTQYLSLRSKPWTMEELREYFKGFDQKKNGFLFAILERETKEHIGNVTLHQIKWESKIGTLGILIGEKEYWGKGVMFESCQLVIKLAFDILGLNKIRGGASIENAMSVVTLKKLGFQVEGRLREEHYCRGKYSDNLIMGLLRKDYEILNRRLRLNR